MFAFFDGYILGTHGADFFSGLDQACFARELPRLAVVEDEHVDAADEFFEGFLGDVDPKIHRIRDDEARLADLV